MIPQTSAHRTLAATLVALQVLLLVSPAIAAENEVERTVAIIELRQGVEPNSQTTDYLREINKTFGDENKGDFILVAASKAVATIGANRQQVPSALTAERRTLLDQSRKKGIEFLDKADAENAIKALRAAEARYRGALAAPGADERLRKDYLDVLAQLATAYVINKDKDNAREVFRNVVTSFGPSAPITDDMYRPDVVQIFQQVVKEMKTMPQGSVAVSSSPVGGRVIFGGIDRGETPVTVGDLIPGVYTMRIQLGKESSLLHRVRIEAGKTSNIEVDLVSESHLIIEEGGIGLTYENLPDAKKRLPIDALAVGKAMGVNLVAVTGVMGHELVTFVVDVANARVVQTTSASVPQIGVSQRAVTRAVRSIMGDQPTAEPAAKTPWYTSVPGLATAGTGVVLLGIGLVFMPALFQNEVFACEAGSDVPYSQCPAGQINTPKAIEVAKEGQADIDTNRTIAGVTLGLGTALVATGAVLFYMHAKRGETSDVAMQLRLRGGVPALPPMAFGFENTRFVAGP